MDKEEEGLEEEQRQLEALEKMYTELNRNTIKQLHYVVITGMRNHVNWKRSTLCSGLFKTIQNRLLLVVCISPWPVYR